MASGKKGLSNWGDILILYELYLALLTPLTESIIYQSVRLAAQECALSRQHSLSLLQDRVRRCHCGLLRPCSHSSRFPASLCARTAAELCEKTPVSGWDARVWCQSGRLQKRCRSNCVRHCFYIFVWYRSFLPGKTISESIFKTFLHLLLYAAKENAYILQLLIGIQA